MSVLVRFFGAAEEAAGGSSRSYDAATLLQLREQLVTGNPAMARVLPQCAVIVAGARRDEDLPLPDGAVVDVLPPFVGG